MIKIVCWIVLALSVTLKTRSWDRVWDIDPVASVLVCAVAIFFFGAIAVCKEGGRLRTFFDLSLMALSIVFIAIVIRNPFYGIKVLAVAGAILNFTVKAANGGRMPVDRLVAAKKGIISPSASHCWADERTRLAFLADRFGSRLVSIYSVASFGDILVWLGLAATGLQLLLC